MTSALLVIDVQRGLFDAAPRPEDADAVLARINTLAAAARQAGAPVIFIQHERPGSALAHGSPGWALEQSLQVEAGDLIVAKTTPDSFLRTELGAKLEAAGVKRLVVCGYASEYCVDTTTRRAAGLGYAVDLVADTHTTHDKAHATATQIRAHHNATLPDLTSFGPVIRALPAAAIRFDA